LDLVLEDIRSPASCFDSLLLSYIKRAGNTIAHLMAQFNLGDGGYEMFCHDVLVCILTLAEMDRA